MAVAQGVEIYAAAAHEHGWRADLADVLRVWRAGSILRMRMLDELAQALDASGPSTTSLLTRPSVVDKVTAAAPAWRRVAAAAISAGYPAPVLVSTLSYVDQLATRPLPTALVQAQRDRFGAHGFRRTDRPGDHHGPWLRPDQEAGG